MYYKENILDRQKFTNTVWKNRIKFSDLLEKYKKGLITDEDWFFDLPGAQKIGYRCFVGGWANCQRLGNPKSRFARETGSRQGKEIIKEAF